MKGFSTDYCADKSVASMKKPKEAGRPPFLWLSPQAVHSRSKDAGGWHASKESRRTARIRAAGHRPV